MWGEEFETVIRFVIVCKKGFDMLRRQVSTWR
jgi:hypothetical protein